MVEESNPHKTMIDISGVDIVIATVAKLVNPINNIGLKTKPMYSCQHNCYYIGKCW